MPSASSCWSSPLLVAGILAVLLDREYTAAILVTGVLVAAVLVIVPRLYVFFRRRRHMQKIRDGLADVIDMLGMCVSGGLPLSAGLEQVARRMTAYPECANELLLLKRQAELGGIKRALEDFTRRVNLPEASQLAGLLLRNTSLGTELVGSLALQADHLRLARRQAALTEANKTPVKLIFPIMFCFAPAVLILLDRAGHHAVGGVPQVQPDVAVPSEERVVQGEPSRAADPSFSAALALGQGPRER